MAACRGLGTPLGSESESESAPETESESMIMQWHRGMSLGFGASEPPPSLPLRNSQTLLHRLRPVGGPVQELLGHAALPNTAQIHADSNQRA